MGVSFFPPQERRFSCLAQVGDDANANLVKDALASAGVSLAHVNTVSAPTGHAVVMLQPGGKNSIIIVGGANVAWPTLQDGHSRLTTDAQQLIKHAGAVLLQREIPDAVNLEAAKVENPESRTEFVLVIGVLWFRV
jgi:sugar/nucleoside kinase (ribokinase family)